MLKVHDLYLTGEITTESSLELIKEIRKIEKLNLKSNNIEHSINLFINSEGGSCTDSIAIIDVITNSKTKITGIGMGLVASMAVYVLASCSRSISYSNTTFIIHNCFYDFKATTKDLKSISTYSKTIDNIIYDIVSKNTKAWKSNLKELLESNVDNYLTSDEMLTLKFIENIIGVDCNV